jgi:hypothetical protein
MLEQRGALEAIKTTNDKPARTAKGALKFRVVPDVYEKNWGPNRKLGNILNEGRSEPSILTDSETRSGLPTPSVASAAGSSALSAAQKTGTASRALGAGLSEPGVQSPPGGSSRGAEQNAEAGCLVLLC